MSTSNEALAVKLDELHADVQEIKQLSKETNGRLRKIELWRERIEGMRIAVAWIPAFAMATIGSGVGAAIALLVR